jgi:hypothetical protein
MHAGVEDGPLAEPARDLRLDDVVRHGSLTAGQANPPIKDKAFSAAVFAMWLGAKPTQEDIEGDLVARAAAVLGAPKKLPR